MTDWLGLEGSTAVITGGSGGIGRALLQGFLAAGARVVTLDRDGAAARDTAAEADPDGQRAFGLGCDVGDAASVAAASLPFFLPSHQLLTSGISMPHAGLGQVTVRAQIQAMTVAVVPSGNTASG